MADISSLPIDIHCSKLLEWLQSRRYCAKNWQQTVLEIRQKISHAIQDMPEHPEIVQLLSGTYIDYFHCQKIVEILKHTESSSKNMFGRYSSQRMKDWQEILDVYKKDNVYLSETAQMLQQYTQYEIPALKKQIVRLEINEQECEKKAIEYEKQSKEMDKLFLVSCQKMGVKGDNLHAELLHLADALPEIYTRLYDRCLKLMPVVQYYGRFLKFILGPSSAFDSLQNLNYLLDSGNVTVFQWKRGFAPASVERATVKIEESNKDTEDVIDFGEEIDFGDSNDQMIDGIEEVGQGQEIDSSLILDETDMVARLGEALTLLESAEFLAALDKDFKELKAFLTIRLLEITKKTSSSDGYTVLDVELEESVDQLREYISLLCDIEKAFDDDNLKHLRKLGISPAYVEQLREKLLEPKNKAAKMMALHSAVLDKAVDSKQKRKEAVTQLEILSKRAKDLQKQIQADISNRYQNRPVNIIGSTIVVKV